MNKHIPMRLQFFADAEETADQNADNTSGEENKETTTQVEEKTFKQEDVNNIVARESKKATEKLLKDLGIEDFENAKDGLAKFKKWQDDQKTEQQRQEEALENLKNDKTTLTSENLSLKSQLAALKQGVKGDSAEDVVALAERMVDDETTIDDAIKKVIEKYPHFAEGEKKEKKPKIVADGNPDGGAQGEPNPFEAKLAKYK